MRNVCLNTKICESLVSNETHMSNFLPLEVVGRDSKTQLQVAEDSNYLITWYRWQMIPDEYLRWCLHNCTVTTWWWWHNIRTWSKQTDWPIWCADKRRWGNAVLILSLRRWPNIKTALGQRLVFAGQDAVWLARRWQQYNQTQIWSGPG